MRFRGLADLRRAGGCEIMLASLPEQILMARYALEKAFKTCDLVRAVHNESCEWYGYTMAHRGNPELIVDIGMPKNDHNLSDYTSVGAEGIAAYQESLPREQIINGWVHSHGALPFEHFSPTDERNQATVLDYVTTLLRKPVAKRELVIRDLVVLLKDQWGEEDLRRGSVSLITDAPVREARIIETIYGGFCYAIVVGDGGWHRQEIHCRTRGILSGQTTNYKAEAALVSVETGRAFTAADAEVLRREVREKVRPGRPVLRERFEKEAT